MPVKQQEGVKRIRHPFSLVSRFLWAAGWRGEPEQEQALLRITITISGILYLLVIWPASKNEAAPWVVGLHIASGFLACSTLLLVVTLVRPQPSIARRILGVVGDVGMTSLVLYFTGPMGAPWYGVFLWVRLGNGVRCGERFLYIAGTASLLGFALAVVLVPYWKDYIQLATGLGVTLLVIWSYSAILIRRLNEARAQADAANWAKSDYLSRMSHEIRMPLNTILGMTEHLRTSTLAPEDKEYVETIYASGKTLERQIYEVLGLSKTEVGRFSLDRLEFDLYALINSTLRIFELQAREKQIQMQASINPSAPFLLCGDPHKLRQVIVTLVANAVKFTDHGIVSLRVYPREQKNKSVALRFEVADTGGGISADRLESIFEPFTQADGSVASHHAGTELSIAICRHLVELMGGQIGLQSTPDLGTTFWFDVAFETAKDSSLDEGHSWTSDCNVIYLRPDGTWDKSIPMMLGDWGISVQVVERMKEAWPLLVSRMSGPLTNDAVIIDGVLCVDDLERLFSLLNDERIVESIPVIVIQAEKYPPDLINRQHDNLYVLNSAIDKRVLFNTLHACYSRHSTEDDVIHIARQQIRQHSALKLLNVLVGDDNATNRLVLSRMLEKMGYRCTSVSAGEAVLTELEHDQYDVVVVGKKMSDMSAVDVFSSYNMAYGGRTSAPFVVLIDDATAETRDICIAAGIQYFLPKPASFRQLQEILDRVIRSEQEFEQKKVVIDNQTHEANLLPVLDDQQVDKLKLLADGDSNFICDIISNFENDAKRDIRGLEIAVVSRDWIAFRDSAEALKAAAMALGMQQLTGLANEAQCMNLNEFENKSINQIKIIQEAIDASVQLLRIELKSYDCRQKKCVTEFCPLSVNHNEARI